MPADMSDFLFMQDGAPPHTANLTQRWCVEHFPRIWREGEWPGNSPDLNPIENLCSILKDRVGQMANATKLEDLILRVKSAWADIDPDIREYLFCSMPARIQLVLDRNDGYIGK
ncbi:Transposase-like [Oopsacas minuta]|uniref:Transposase-like n=1 Tax=Oopsacas minuta TaxID=111878 RepID=A0AAV7JI28_9METZ|nr:Transposase-like [Oopsacas minuta]